MRKPSGRLGKTYRIMWNDDGGLLAFYNPPVEPESVAAAHLGFLEGTPVDAYLCAPGNCAGYTVVYPTQVAGMEFIVDRLKSGAGFLSDKSVPLWRYAENVRALWESGHDVLQIQWAEARRLGIDFWFQLRMNDWHHTGPQGQPNLMSSAFYDGRDDLRIGEKGSRGWPKHVAERLMWFQDFAHEEVRRLRRELATELCQRYDADGVQYDFMRCPGYFKYGQEEAGLAFMTELIRKTREALDEIGERKGRPLGLSVRVPNTIDGSMRLGLDVLTWIREDLVDIVVPSTFFNQDMEEDMREWVELARGTGARINAAIEEGYMAGHTGGVLRCFYHGPVMLPLTCEMINGLAARHWRSGVDGLYVFNWFGTTATYNYDNRPALDDIGNAMRLAHKNKCYVVMRRDESWPNCFGALGQVPLTVGTDPITVKINVADDLSAAKSRLKAARLRVHYTNRVVGDEVEVTMNGRERRCSNPMQPGVYDLFSTLWHEYDLTEAPPRCGENEISFRLVKRNERFEAGPAITIEDVELHVAYHYPNGPWEAPPGLISET